MNLIKLTEVKKKTSLGKTLIYKLIGEGKFPASVSIGERAVAWLETEVDEWVQQKIDIRENEIAGAKESCEEQSHEITEKEVISWIRGKFERCQVGDVINWLLTFYH